MRDLSRVIALGVLGLCSVILVVGLVLLSVEVREVPPSLSAVLGTCIGALSALLAQRENPGSQNGAGKEKTPAPGNPG